MFRESIAVDPISFVHRYNIDEDREIAGFIASQFAYGKIDLFRGFLESLFRRMGDSPFRYIQKGDFRALRGLYYRFQDDGEIVCLLTVLRKVINVYGSLGELFRRLYAGSVRETVWRIRGTLGLQDDELVFFFPREKSTGPMKRWNLYLRWMVRKDDIDIGLWDFIDKRDLVVPLDTHVFKIGKCLQWTKKKNPSWSAAEEITGALRRIDALDPLKYDFFLCHRIGIAAKCRGARTKACADRCIVYELGEKPGPRDTSKKRVRTSEGKKGKGLR